MLTVNRVLQHIISFKATGAPNVLLVKINNTHSTQVFKANAGLQMNQTVVNLSMTPVFTVNKKTLSYCSF